MMLQQLAGMYTLKKYCAITGQLKQEIGPFKNKITNIGLDRVGAGNMYNRAFVGTGTSPSTNTDSAMGNLTAQTVTVTDSSSRSSVVPYWSQVTRTYRFAAGTIVGNITEVGVGWAAGGVNALWSRELIVDSAGNPITLTVLENEFLDVVYSLRFYPSTEDFTGSVTINGIVYNYTARTANINSANVNPTVSIRPVPRIQAVYGGPATLGPVTGSLVGGTGGQSVTEGAVTPYVTGSYSLAAVSSFALGSGNVAGGITSMLLATRDQGGQLGSISQQWQLVLDKPIPKTSSNTLGITLSVAWARFTGTIIP